MSNTIEEDPIGHTSKFLWILAILPLIGQVMVLALPGPETMPAWARYNGGLAALVTAAIGLGVHRRSLLAVRIGMVLFGVASLALVAFALLRAEGNRAGVVLAALPVWALLKLNTVAGVLQGKPAAS